MVQQVATQSRYSLAVEDDNAEDVGAEQTPLPEDPPRTEGLGGSVGSI